MPVIAFDTIPELGLTITVQGQRYMLDEVEPYVRKDGEATTLLRWRSMCAECGVPFSFRTPLRTNGFNRRCDEHKRPGSRLRRRNGGKRNR